MALPAGVRFDDGDGLLRGWDPLGPPLEFPTFNIGALAVERVVIERLDQKPDSDGRISVVRRRYDGDSLRGVARLVLDRDRRVVSIGQALLGGTITLRATDRDTALQKRPIHTVPLELSIASPFRISPAAMQGHIRYRFSFVDRLAFNLPETGEQRAMRTNDSTTVDICETCGPGLADTAEALADARKPTPWLQSDAAMIRAIATPIARLPLSDAGKMKLLAKRAREHLKRVEVSGHYSALDALKRGAGDCTEDAVVLAALGRAAGIPTRVANGLVYARQRFHGTSNAFLPHSWTLAWADGAWRSFDLSLGDFDATHLALTVGDGDARSVLAANQLAGLLRWDGMNEVRPRPVS
ncbi:MAG: transglutaminase-like domain-containing protein [Sphingomonas sp.]